MKDEIFIAMKIQFFALVFLSASMAFGQAPQPELLTALSSELPEFATTHTPNGRYWYFNRTNADRSKMWVLEAKKSQKGWKNIQIPPFSDTTYRDVDPFVSPNGRHLFFSSNRPLPGRKTDDFNLWVCAKKGKNWAAPQPLEEALNTTDDEIFSTVSANGNLYFTRFSSEGKAQIFCAPQRGAGYGPAQRVVILHDTLSTANPAISPDERWLAFFSRELGGFGSADIFVCQRRSDGTWSAPSNLGPTVNTAFAEFAPAFSPDGKTLFFTSERPGVVQDFPADKRRPGDLYRIDFQALVEEIFPK
jgi:Tol biopolymer transport system component